MGQDQADVGLDAGGNMPRLLLVDDDPIITDSLSIYLRRQGYAVDTAPDGTDALHALATASYGLVITDVNMPGTNGLELLRAIRQRHPGTVVIVLTGYGTIENAVEAIKQGAFEYLTKPVIDDEIKVAVEKALRQHTLIAENQSLKQQLNMRYGLDNIVGHDYKMLKVFDLVEAVADSKTTVLMTGESGTGKSLVARAIHHRSSRKDKPFVEINCGAIPESLLESELFGHVKGSFTGATADKPGRFLVANGGTIFLDEINSASPAFQVKLLRVLQERKFEPVGSSQTVSVDVRVILASNQDLAKLVAENQFRQDLYYRINVVNIVLPSLRERLGDIELLAEDFLKKFCREMKKRIAGFTPEAMGALQRYSWPGNVRELENAIERAVVLSKRPMIDVTDLPPAVVEEVEEESGGGLTVGAVGGLGGVLAEGSKKIWTPMALAKALEEPERAILLAALEANHWNRQETARQLDINRTTLYKKMKYYGIEGGGEVVG